MKGAIGESKGYIDNLNAQASILWRSLGYYGHEQEKKKLLSSAKKKKKNGLIAVQALLSKQLFLPGNNLVRAKRIFTETLKVVEGFQMASKAPPHLTPIASRYGLLLTLRDENANPPNRGALRTNAWHKYWTMRHGLQQT